MPRRKPEVPPTRQKPSSFKTKKNYDYSCCVPCINYKCDGFMFLCIAKHGTSSQVFDEMECFVCKRIKKIGSHNPKRSKPKPFSRKSHR